MKCLLWIEIWLAENIEVPRDFVKGGSVTNSTFDQYNLNKNDGRSVNSGGSTTVVEDNSNSIITEENLGNIKKNDTLNVSEIDSNSIINKENLQIIFLFCLTSFSYFLLHNKKLP